MSPPLPHSLKKHSDICTYPILSPYYSHLTYVSFIFYIEQIMPCCGHSLRFLKGPRGGLSMNIECYWCKQRWNSCPPFNIEKI